MKPIRLGVNIDHVATVRQARRTTEPDPVTAALLAEMGGADLITVHLREDRRHIQDRDLKILREVVQVKLNMEMAATEKMIAIALAIRPDWACIVPESRQEITTEGGLDLNKNAAAVETAVSTLQNAGIKVSLFIDPDIDMIKAAAKLSAKAVELHTGQYANARNDHDIAMQLDRAENACKTAHRLGLGVHAGHGLTYRNIKPIVAIAELEELNIGHSIISRAIMVGMERAVHEMVGLLKR